MSQVLLNIRCTKGAPSIDQVCKKFGFKQQELDLQFGVIEIDPKDDLYCISVDQEAVQRVQKSFGDDASSTEGPFSNPPIAPFGPPIE